MKKVKPGPGLLIKATMIGSILIGLFGYVATAGATALASSSPPTNPSSPAIVSTPTIPPVQPQPTVASNASQDQGNHTSQTLNCEISSSYPASIQQWCGLITKYANQEKLSPDLVAALVLQESGGKPQAYSQSGAVGLMQIMPSDGIAASFYCIAGPCFASRPTIAQLEEPGFNLQYGTKMLAGLLNKYGNIRDALAAYGPMNVGYYYADKVLNIYNNYGK